MYHFRSPKFPIAENKWKAIHLLWRQAGSASYLWQTCLNVGYRLYLQTYYLTQAIRQTHPPRAQTYLLVWIVPKDRLSKACILSEQLCAQIKTMDQCPRDLRSVKNPFHVVSSQNWSKHRKAFYLMHELSTQDTQVITAEGCDFQLHNTQAATSAWLPNQEFSAICDKEHKHPWSQEAAGSPGDSKTKKAVSQRHGLVYRMLGCAEAYREKGYGENWAVNTAIYKRQLNPSSWCTANTDRRDCSALVASHFSLYWNDVPRGTAASVQRLLFFY